MKTNLFVVLLVLGAICMSSTLVDAFCSSLIRQYFSCRHLKMIALNTTGVFGMRVVEYVRDGSLENNTLDQEFFQKQLDNMDMNEAMKLFQTIFDTIENCTSEFCQCIASGIPTVDKQYRYGKIFADPSMVEQVKAIIRNFNEKYPSTSALSSDSLEKFCSSYDFTIDKVISIPEALNCVLTDPNTYAKFVECALPLVINANLQTILLQDISYLDPASQEKIAVCDMQRTSIISCPVEMQRYFSLTLLARFSSDAFAQVKSIDSFSDALMNKIRNYTAKIEYGEVGIELFPFSQSYLTNRSAKIMVKHLEGIGMCPAGYLVDTTVFKVFDWEIRANLATNRLEFKSFELKLKNFTKKIDFEDVDGPIIDCTIDRSFEKNDKMRIVSSKDDFVKRDYKIADFKNGILMLIDSKTIKLFGPVSTIKQADGILNNGCNLLRKIVISDENKSSEELNTETIGPVDRDLDDEDLDNEDLELS